MAAPVSPFRAPAPLDVVKRGLAWPALPEPWLRAQSPIRRLLRPLLCIAAALVMPAVINTIAPSLWWVWAILVVTPLFGTIFRNRRFNIRLGHAVQKQQMGQLVEARRDLETLARAYRSVGGPHGLAVFQLALTELKSGNHARAVQLLATTNRTWLMKMSVPQVGEIAPFWMATAYGLLGDLDAAEAWLAHAEQKRSLRQFHAGELSHAVVSCRRRRFAEVVERVDRNWRLLESSENAGAMRAVRAVRALALSSLPDRAAEVAAAAEGLRSPFRGDLDWMATSWPEMQSFLAEHRL